MPVGGETLLSMTTRILITQILTRATAHFHMAHSLFLHHAFALIAVTMPFKLTQPTVTMTPLHLPFKHYAQVGLTRFETNSTGPFVKHTRTLNFSRQLGNGVCLAADTFDPQSVSFTKHFNINIPFIFRSRKFSIPL
jgi:hypothetical protein